MILPKIAVPLGFSQILCSSITWNKHKESLFVNSEDGQDLLKSKSWYFVNN